MRLNHIFLALAIILLALCGTLIAMMMKNGAGSLFFIAEGLVVACIAFLILFYSRLVRPMRTIMSGLDLLKEQDFSSRLRYVGQYEVDQIIDVFNPMMEQLKANTLKMKEQSHVLDMIATASPMGIVMTSANGSIAFINPAGSKMLGIAQGAKSLALASNKELATRMMDIPRNAVDMMRLSDAEVYRCSHLTFLDYGFTNSFYIIEAITQVVGMAERQAYEKVIRLMAHEVNNTVCGVNSTLDTVAMLMEDADMKQTINACSERTSALSNFITRYASIVKIPSPELREVSVRQMLENSRIILDTLCTRHSAKLDCGVECDFMALIDVPLMEQVLTNIVKNAVESPGTKHVCVSLDPASRALVVADDGGGISEEAAKHIFTPFYTSKPDGQGLGLMLVHRVLTDHRCTFSLATSPIDSLTRFTIKFPPMSSSTSIGR